MSEYFLDEFTRANGGLGANWTTFGANAPTITNNIANAGSSDCGAVWNANTFGADQWVMAKMAINGDAAGDKQGLLVRASGSGATLTGYHLGVCSNEQYWYLRKVINNSWTTIASGSVSLGSDVRLQLIALGSTIVSVIDDIERDRRTDTSIASGGSVGFYANNAVGDTWYDCYGGDCALSYTEDFTGVADSTAIYDLSGSRRWHVVNSNAMTVLSNKLKANGSYSDQVARLYYGHYVDQYSQATISWTTNSDLYYEGVAVRVANSAGTKRGYNLQFDSTGNTWRIWKSTAYGSSGSQLASGNYTLQNNDVVKLTAVGTGTVTLTAYVNGAQIGTVNDSSTPFDFGSPGVMTYGKDTSSVRWDDLSMGPIVADVAKGRLLLNNSGVTSTSGIQLIHDQE